LNCPFFLNESVSSAAVPVGQKQPESIKSLSVGVNMTRASGIARR